MRRHQILKIKFFTGVITAYAILIGAFIYYSSRQDDYADRISNFSEVFREKSIVLSNFENELLRINRVKSDFTTGGSSRTILQISSTAQKAHQSLLDFEQPNTIFEMGFPEIEQLHTLLGRISQLDSTQLSLEHKTVEEKIIALRAEEQDIHNTCNRVLTVLYIIKKEKIEQEKKSLDGAINIVLPLGIMALLAILYILYITYRISEDLRLYTKKEKQTKAELTVANDRFESINWILERTNRINDELIGIDKIAEIGRIALLNIMRSMDESFYAGAIYLKDDKSSTFNRSATLGFKDTEGVSSFKAGEGILGIVVQQNTIKIYNTESAEQIKLYSTFIENIRTQIILVPIAQDQEVTGLLELAVHVAPENIAKTTEYLTRAARTIATAFKTGHNHATVQRLLRTTQKQTEELSAQQEELRMTNEELVYKTNLLESSEEELRVQQEELSQSNSELNAKALELENRNQDLKIAQKVVESKIAEVEQASQYKSEFMANMSHELRTPLNSILILAKLLQDNKLQNLTDDQCKYASVIYSAGSDLLELINQLLDLAKIESGNVEMLSEKITTSTLVQNLENLFKQTAKSKNITFKILAEDFPAVFISDEYRLEQVLRNFLSNAFKFTNSNGEIDLHLTQKDNNLYFSVKDTGKGIPEEKRQLIFEAFRQEDGSTSRKYGGTGLGLSISREIANLLGGSISLESELDKGSIFTLTIPLYSIEVIEKAPAPVSVIPEAVAELPAKHLPKDLERVRTILIVEDDVQFSEILKEFAEQYDFQVSLAHDGGKAIEIAKEQLPDAIILDVALPISDGWEVLRELKSDPTTQFIPVHMMSAANFNQRDILEKGAIGFMPKPVSEKNIQKVFSNILFNINKDVKKVLLVEDQEVMSDFIKNTFAEQNINILQAFTKKSALEKLQTEDNIDCMILDITLPDGSGLDLLEQIKKDDAFKNLPVIINTAEELTSGQADRIARYTKSMIHKDGKSTNRLIDEVNLFLNKIHDTDYQSINRNKKMEMAAYAVANNLKGKRVLVVDDDMRNVFALTTALQEHDLQIEVANNGLEALNIIHDQNNTFDIVLMDVMMPEMDGYEAIEHIRSEKRFAKLPIIAVTAKAMKGDHEKLIQLGASDYISKPIDMRKLIALMQVWLS